MTPYPVAQVEIHGTQKAGKEKPSLGGDMEQVARVAKLSREAWNWPLTGEQPTENMAVQELK